jgi:hypothetical protein
MLGIGVSESTVAKYMIRHRKPPSQTWRTFPGNHVSELVSVDFFTGAPAAVPTAPRLPWQNPYVERMIGSIRRE